jgi:hypothetical protein
VHATTIRTTVVTVRRGRRPVLCGVVSAVVSVTAPAYKGGGGCAECVDCYVFVSMLLQWSVAGIVQVRPV